jgi:hypothetical protein
MFLFTKNPRYFFDQDAVREPHRASSLKSNGIDPATGKGYASNYEKDASVHGLDKFSGNMVKGAQRSMNPSGRNIRNWWVINPRPYPGAHYAVFPPELIYPCIKSGTSEKGVCDECGSPYERVVERSPMEVREGPGRAGLKASGNGSAARTAVTGTMTKPPESRTIGWQPTCSCNAEIVPATVLDPFMGSGTTALAARKLGRKSIGLDIDARNIQLIQERLGYQEVLL